MRTQASIAATNGNGRMCNLTTVIKEFDHGGFFSIKMAAIDVLVVAAVLIAHYS